MIDLIAILVWALCKGQQIITELCGYFFILLVMFSICGMGVTTSGLLWMAVLAVALFALNRTLIHWTEMEG